MPLECSRPLTSSKPEGEVAEGTTRASVEPTARMAACKGTARRPEADQQCAWNIRMEQVWFAWDTNQEALGTQPALSPPDDPKC